MWRRRSSRWNEIARPSSTRRRDLFALAQVELARRKRGDRFDAANLFRNPQIRNARFPKFLAQLRKIDIDRAEQDNGFAFAFVRHTDNGDKAIGLTAEVERS